MAVGSEYRQPAPKLIGNLRTLTRRVVMLKKLGAKWGLLVCGSSLAALQLGQCLADFLEDVIVFNVVN